MSVEGIETEGPEALVFNHNPEPQEQQESTWNGRGVSTSTQNLNIAKVTELFLCSKDDDKRQEEDKKNEEERRIQSHGSLRGRIDTDGNKSLEGEFGQKSDNLQWETRARLKQDGQGNWSGEVEGEVRKDF